MQALLLARNQPYQTSFDSVIPRTIRHSPYFIDSKYMDYRSIRAFFSKIAVGEYSTKSTYFLTSRPILWFLQYNKVYSTTNTSLSHPRYRYLAIGV